MIPDGKMAKKTFQVQIKDKLTQFILSARARSVFLIAGFICLIILRQFLGTFGFSLGYLYMILIVLAGFWFGVKGGLVAATIASLIFLAEISFFEHNASWEVALHGILLRLFAYFLGGTMLGYLADANRKLRQKLESLAYYDDLTGCMNFVWAKKLLQTELSRSKRYKREMTITMLGIDKFKEINSKYGYITGNDVLKTFAQALQNNIRNVDIVGRFRGDEFLIIFSEAGSKKALLILERIRAQFSKVRVTIQDPSKETFLELDFSAGVASYPYNGENVNDLISFAWNALYQAKKEGQNRLFIERRRWLRASPILGLKAEVVDPYNKEAVQLLNIDNISQKGMLLIFYKNIPSEEFTCRIQFPYEHFHSELNCKIVHKEKFDDNTYHVGVDFKDMPSHVEEKLIRYINRVKDLTLEL